MYACMYVCIFVYLYAICESVYLHVCMYFVCLSVCLSKCMPISLSSIVSFWYQKFYVLGNFDPTITLFFIMLFLFCSFSSFFFPLSQCFHLYFTFSPIICQYCSLDLEHKSSFQTTSTKTFLSGMVTNFWFQSLILLIILS